MQLIKGFGTAVMRQFYDAGRRAGYAGLSGSTEGIDDAWLRRAWLDGYAAGLVAKFPDAREYA
ncbi:hypothetical protein BLA9940_02095 [Burkholderia aenigmatica]|uniref:hypothetical protein n=1 Tax=Burkholderia aenigmatica TaxID=2015348 RepID=UPI0014539146|nr:hypothetical protein [Burkholderia aenigmatica]VWC53764.1 hypothetical protein BLA9940_02095 [Burkholderia aenigmatica]